MKDAVETTGEYGRTESSAYYRQKYKALKRKLRLLVYEQECFIEELKSTQKKLLKVSRDKSFLLDRLLQLETLEETTSDSDATASSDDSEFERRRTRPAVKRRKRPIMFAELPNMNEAATALLAQMSAEVEEKVEQPSEQKTETGPTARKRAKTTTKRSDRSRAKKTSSQTPSGGQSTSCEPALYTGMLTREEVERQLDAKKPVMGIEKAQDTLPMEIFSNENQHHELGEK